MIRKLSMQKPTNSTVALRANNRAAILKYILLSQETTRADIARDCDVSVASASNIVAELMDEGLIMEEGRVSSGGGRPISRIRTNPGGVYVIGADVGEQGVAVELFDFGLHCIDKEFQGKDPAATPHEISQDLQAAVNQIHQRHEREWERLIGIGLGLPGVVEETETTHMLYAQTLGWEPMPITDLLTSDIPVTADNGANAQAKQEQWFGSAKDVSNAVVVLLGRGVGAGIIVEGDLVNGAVNSAAEWGHMTVSFDGRTCRCGNRGCLEAYTGSDQLVQMSVERGIDLGGTGWSAINKLFQLADDGDSSAKEIVSVMLDALGAGIGSLVNLLNPTRVVIGGWVGLCVMNYRSDDLKASIRRHSLKHLGEQFDLVLSHSNGDSVAIGAALGPLERFIQEGGISEDSEKV